jgi:chemotaxis protein methyltransferase CheR
MTHTGNPTAPNVATPRARAKDQPLVPGEFLLTGEDFRNIAAMLHADAGIYLPDTKATLVYSRLAKRLRALGLETFRDYCTLIAGSDGVGERQKMIAALTTNVTRFFREPHHFDHLKKHVLLPLVEEARRGRRIRLWSAGCSSGQEPYTIALCVLSLLPEAASLDVKILATDIDPHMIADGRNGAYSEAAVADVPADLRKHYFVRVTGDGGKVWGVSNELRDLVAFRELNLNGAWPMKGPFEAIFCRNVVIYFEEQTQQKIWSRYVPLLVPGGYLYVGHSERVSGPAAAQFQSDGITTYRLQGEGRK